MFQTILKAGVENLNDRIYSEDTLKKIIKQFNKKKKSGISMYGHYGMNTDRIIQTPILVVNKLSKRKDILSADIDILDNSATAGLRDIIIENLKSGKTVVRPAGIGVVDADKNVHIKQIISFNIIPKEDDAYNGIL